MDRFYSYTRYTSYTKLMFGKWTVNMQQRLSCFFTSLKLYFQLFIYLVFEAKSGMKGKQNLLNPKRLFLKCTFAAL